LNRNYELPYLFKREKGALTEMVFSWFKEKPLRAVWKVEKEGRRAFLVGTAHFFPYSFRKALTKLIQNVETVLFEGPLDKESMERVVQYGHQGENRPSISEVLDPAAIKEINRQLSSRLTGNTTAGSYLQLIHPESSDFLEVHTRGVRPWLAFFTVWSAFLDWKYSMDLEAFRIAQEFGKTIQYLETLEDQLAALDGIPFERFVRYLNRIGNWKKHKEMFLKAFLAGDLEKFVSMTGEFPTRCELILAKRDPIFFKGIKASFEKGETAAFVGAAHIPGIRKMFLEEGYRVTQEES
jgi:uncharacterized protein YbaP (TraB family)